MIPKKLLALALSFSVHFLFAQDLLISNFSDAIKKNADAVVVYDNYSIDLMRQDKMLIHRKTQITIFNKNANYLAELTLPYDKSNHIESVNMVFFDTTGKRIKKVKKSDFDDYSATDGNTLYSDDRVIHYNHTATSYPYTVIYEYELDKKYTAFIPKWLPIRNYNIGVLSSTYSFAFPDDYKIQKLESYFDIHPIDKIASQNSIQYKLSNFSPLQKEYLSPSFSKLVPSVKLASNKFHLAGVDGTANNWLDFGKWMNTEILASRNNLSAETISKVKKMVKDIPDPIERAKIIYEYVQNKTRYISVQMEIGGWQPMLTNDVDKLGYGDCKALTFYTKSLMDIAEVPSLYTLVFAGYDKYNIKKEVVSQQGNHAILSLPTPKDTIWLECTSQKMPFGSINSNTEDRDVLVIAPTGGKIVRTNTNKPENNLQKTIASLSLHENGGLSGLVDVTSYGSQYEKHLQYFDGLTPDDLNKSMKEYLNHLNNLSFSRLIAKNNKEKKSYQENIEFTAESYATINADGTILFHVNALNRITHIPDRERNRTTSFEILRGYQDVDEYNFTIPETYIISELPETVFLENRFGTYTMSIEKTSDTTFLYKRSILMQKGLFEKEQYKAYRAFRKKIRKLENTKIIITKK